MLHWVWYIDFSLSFYHLPALAAGSTASLTLDHDVVARVSGEPPHVRVCVCVWWSECASERAFAFTRVCVWVRACPRVRLRVWSYTIPTVFVIFCSHYIACLWRMCNKSWQNITKHKCVFINKGKLFQALHIFSCEHDTGVKLFQSCRNCIEIEFSCAEVYEYVLG